MRQFDFLGQNRGRRPIQQKIEMRYKDDLCF